MFYGVELYDAVHNTAFWVLVISIILSPLGVYLLAKKGSGPVFVWNMILQIITWLLMYNFYIVENNDQLIDLSLVYCVVAFLNRISYESIRKVR